MVSDARFVSFRFPPTEDSDPRWAIFESAIKRIHESPDTDARDHMTQSNAAIGELFSDRKLRTLRTLHSLDEGFVLIFTFHGTNKAIYVDMRAKMIGVVSVDAPLP